MTTRQVSDHQTPLERMQAAQRRLIIAKGAYDNTVTAATQRLRRDVARHGETAGESFVRQLLGGAP